MDSLWDNPNPDDRVDGTFIFTDSPAPNTAPSLECHCLSTHPLPVATPGGKTPQWPRNTKCQANGDWSTWLNDANNPALDVASGDKAFAAILVPRTPGRPGFDEASNNHTRVLEYLPFESTIFDTIKQRMLLHTRAMTILLHRGVPVITRIPAMFHNIECQVYILRIKHALNYDHQELVVTHVPDLQQPATTLRGRKTYAVVLGTSKYDRNEYSRILKFSTQETISSPFTIIKIFLGLERDRRWKQIDKKISTFHRKFFNLGTEDDGNASNTNTAVQEFDASSDPQGLVKLYMDISYLKDNLAAWTAQLEGFLATITDDKPNDKTADFKFMQTFLSMLVCEYKSKINQCETILQGASLRFQMETVNLSRKDTNIALRDGKQMKAIAVLTMVFLPGTFVATLLAVPKFESGTMGPDGWPAWSMYLILFVVLTGVVLGWYSYYIRYHKPKSLVDIGSNV